MKSSMVATNPRSCGSVKILFIVVVAFQLVMMVQNNGRLIGWFVREETTISSSLATDRGLPTCEKLMNTFPSLRDGAFLTRGTTTVEWKMRHDGSRELTLPNTCRLKRYTAQDARLCLQHRHLAMVGDSLTRYQYLSFMFFIENGTRLRGLDDPHPARIARILKNMARNSAPHKTNPTFV